MNSLSSIASLTLLLVAVLVNCSAFTASYGKHAPARSQGLMAASDGNEITNDRRAILNSMAAAALGGVTLSLKPSPATAAAAGAESFVGKYSDPINHPGGTREIKLTGAVVGDYQLAEVYGGGGRGEPKEYVLPAMVIGNRAIIIDFSPKGGPKDFTGVLEKDGIKFIRDGNKWPRLE